MCLETATFIAPITMGYWHDDGTHTPSTVSPKKYKVSKVGWKYFYERKKGEFKGPFQFDIYSANKWYTDDSERVLPTEKSPKTEYFSGFHIFTSREEARKFRRYMAQFGCISGSDVRLCKVRYNDVTTEGEQGGSKVVVARKMKILRETK